MAALVLCASDLDLRDAMRAELEARHHDVIVASTAARAVERLREGGVDLVVVDFEVVGGIALLMAGMEKLPDAPPLILISGAPDAPGLSAHLGAAAFVPKPCNLDDLARAVDRLATT